MKKVMKRTLAAMVAGAILSSAGPVLAQGKVVKFVQNGNLTILDPIWTTAYVTRNHGYFIYDTLFAADENNAVKPQMVDKYEVSADKTVWTFTLRDGLEWHDGKPVTSEDCIASIKRWGARDAMGQKLMDFVKEFKEVNPKTFQMVLKEPYGLVLDSLGKPSSQVPFMMPKRVADTDPFKQIDSQIGSGPFIYVNAESKPGEKHVYAKNPKYKPRAEPPSGLAGGKVAKVDRVEWVSIPDAQTAINALQQGEIDMIEQPSHDLLPVIEKDKNVEIVIPDRLGSTYILRFNWKQPPFNDVRYRRAAMVALNQKDFLQAVIGDPRYYKVCKAMFGCGTPLENAAGTDGILESRFEESKKMLKEAGYDGTPIVLLQSTDLAVLTNLAPVAKTLLERGGFKVDMQSMDWQTLVARRAKKVPVADGGWNIAMTAAAAVLLIDPVNNHYAEASGDRAQFGWPLDEEIERLRLAFVGEGDPKKQFEIAEQVQKRILDGGVTVPLGQFLQPMARRKGVTGNIESPVTVFWNVEKK